MKQKGNWTTSKSALQHKAVTSAVFLDNQRQAITHCLRPQTDKNTSYLDAVVRNSLTSDTKSVHLPGQEADVQLVSA